MLHICLNICILYARKSRKMFLKKESSSNFFTGQFDALKYDIILSENGHVIDRFIPEILMLKVRLKCVEHTLNRKMTLFCTFRH